MSRTWQTTMLAVLVAAALAAAAPALGADVLFQLPAGASAADACRSMPGGCAATFGRAAYVRSDLSPAAVVAAVRAANPAFAGVRATYDVLQDATEGTLYPEDFSRYTFLAADIAVSTDAGLRDADLAVRGRNTLAQAPQPRTQPGAPYHLEILNQKQRNLCRRERRACAYADGVFVQPSRGAGVRVYALGEAVDRGHADVAGRVAPEQFVYADYAAASRDICARWQGTHVAALAAGTVFGVAKDATLVSVAVKPGCRGIGYARALAEGLAWTRRDMAAHPAPAVVLVATKVPVRQPNDVVVALIDELTDELLRAGAVVVAAAGAAAVDACAYTPGRLPGVVTVAPATVVQLPTERVATPWASANFGACVTLWAPGFRVHSAFAPGNATVGVFSGSPQAAAIVAGVAAAELSARTDGPGENVTAALLNASSVGVMAYTRPRTVLNFAQVPHT